MPGDQHNCSKHNWGSDSSEQNLYLPSKCKPAFTRYPDLCVAEVTNHNRLIL